MFWKIWSRKTPAVKPKRPEFFEKLLSEAHSPVIAQKMVKRLLADTLIARAVELDQKKGIFTQSETNAIISLANSMARNQ
jgi:hypothetical protein